MREGAWSEDFAFIAGFTEGGAPFGTTWQEMEEMEKQESEKKGNIRATPAQRTIRVDMNDLEPAFESRSELFRDYLDTESGECLAIPGYGYDADVDDEMAAGIEKIDSAPLGRYLLIEPEMDLRPSLDDAREFVHGVESEGLRRRLEGALGQRRGAFRRFLDILHTEAGEVERWYHIRRQRLWERIAGYLESEGLTVVYDSLPPFVPRHATRQHLLAAGVQFVDRVKQVAGVERIALIGSMATPKREPNDIDLLLTLSTSADIAAIAAAGRKLKGRAQNIGRGADIFLADREGRYLGRTCPWRECAPGLRMRCEAQHCGTYLYDDLHVLTLESRLLASPPLQIWPETFMRQEIPDDVLEAFGIRP